MCCLFFGEQDNFTYNTVLSFLQLNKYIQILSQHAVDPELVKQVFRQVTMATHIKFWNLFEWHYLHKTETELFCVWRYI